MEFKKWLLAVGWLALNRCARHSGLWIRWRKTLGDGGLIQEAKVSLAKKLV
jgi:hypothetical protein